MTCSCVPSSFDDELSAWCEMNVGEICERHVERIAEDSDTGVAEFGKEGQQLASGVPPVAPREGRAGDAPKRAPAELERLEPRPALVDQGTVRDRIPQQVGGGREH